MGLLVCIRDSTGSPCLLVRICMLAPLVLSLPLGCRGCRSGFGPTCALVRMFRIGGSLCAIVLLRRTTIKPTDSFFTHRATCRSCRPGRSTCRALRCAFAPATCFGRTLFVSPGSTALFVLLGSLGSALVALGSLLARSCRPSVFRSSACTCGIAFCPSCAGPWRFCTSRPTSPF